MISTWTDDNNFVSHTPLHSRFTPSHSYYFFTPNSEEKSFEIENDSIDFDFFQALKSFLAADLLIHICIHASNFRKWHFHMFPASILKKKGLCMSKSYDNYVFIWIKCHSPMTISCWIVKSQRPFPQAISMAKWEFSFILKFHSSEIKGFWSTQASRENPCSFFRFSFQATFISPHEFPGLWSNYQAEKGHRKLVHKYVCS